MFESEISRQQKAVQREFVGAHRKNPSTIMPATFQGVADKCYDQYFTLGKRNHLGTDQVRQYARRVQTSHTPGRTLRLRRIARYAMYCEQSFFLPTLA